MSIRHVYLVFWVLGFLLPYSQFVPWLQERGLNPSLFAHDLFANRVGYLRHAHLDRIDVSSDRSGRGRCP